VQRLSHEAGQRVRNGAGQRLSDDRGAVGVVVALLMVPLIGFAAISIDVAAMWSERQQLQTGADAGALAVAQDCSRGSCGDAIGTAQALAAGNLGVGASSASVTSTASNSVTVTTSGVREHFFAPVLGIDSSTIVASASAGWGAPSGGTAELPLAISWCDFQAQTGGGVSTGDAVTTIALTVEPEPVEPEPVAPAVEQDADPAVEPGLDLSVPPQATPEAGDSDGTGALAASCAGPRGTTVAGGFAWLAGSDGCATSSSIAGGAAGSAGDALPGGCSAGDFGALQGRTVLLPVYDQAPSAGGAGSYRVYGYAGFTLTGYHFAGQFGWRDPCSGSDSCISGTFTRWADLSDHFDHDDAAPQLGATVVSLTK
jgi:hypothetical protein